MTDRSELTPGSPLSEAHGCICPVMDNAGGRGTMINGEVMFWINGACPIHGKPEALPTLSPSPSGQAAQPWEPEPPTCGTAGEKTSCTESAGEGLRPVASDSVAEVGRGSRIVTDDACNALYPPPEGGAS